MSRMSSVRQALPLLLALAAGSVPAHVAAQVVPPTVAEGVEARYPDAARAANRGRVVVPMRIVIEPDGTVSDAQILEPQGDGLDEAALEAVRDYAFTPASRDGRPIRVAIRFELALEPPITQEDAAEVPEPEVPDEPPPPPPGRLEGQLLDAESGAAVADCDVALVDAEGRERFARTDAEGRFAFDDVAPGDYRVAARPLGFPERIEAESVVSGEATTVLYRLVLDAGDEEDEEGVYVARATTDPPPREVTRRSLPAEVLNSIPGTRGDPIRAIEILPGIARPPFGLGLVIVRGSAPGDTEVLLDGVPIPLLYHFGGLTSVFNGRLLDRVDFYPGNFSSRYGRKMGGIIEVDTRDPRTDRIHGVVELGLIDASLLLEGPVTERFAIAGSIRRSFIDAWFGAVVPEGLGVTAAPTYYDYQLLGTYRPTERDRVRFRFYGSDDRFKLFFGNDFADDPAARGALALATRFNFFQTNWKRNVNDRTTQELVLQVGPTRLQFGLGTLARFDLQAWNVFGRAEWVHSPSDRLRIVAGLDISTAAVDIGYIGGAIGQSEGNVQDQSNAQVAFSQSVFNARPGAYVDAALTAGDFVLNGAVRADYYSEINGYSVDPRLVAQLRVHEDVRLRAGAGLFSQPPEFPESAPTIGNPDLEPIHSAHFGLGADWTIGEGINLTLDGFYKPIWNRVIGTADGSAPRFVNDGIGRIYGLEVQGRIQPSEARRYYGYLAYTLMRSERNDRGVWRPFDFDQTHIFTTTFMYLFRRGWELGGTVRLITGNPYTPVIGSVFDPVNQSYYPINGVTNSARLPFFNRFDVRVQKTWTFDAWKLALFLDVQNATNRMNPEGVLYNYDYTQQSTINGLPIIPALGIRGEF